MRRKDCEDRNLNSVRPSVCRPARVPRLVVLLALLVCAPVGASRAGTVRLWPHAVVVDDTVRLSDLCELKGFDPNTERELVGLAVAGAPVAGGSRVIHRDMIRSVLAEGGANMAQVRLSGATRCAVTRPSHVAPAPARSERTVVRSDGMRKRAADIRPTPSATLRQAVLDYFNAEFARYRGKADVVFDHTSQKVLDLSGPTYDFRLRRRSSSPLGLIQLEVSVLADGGCVQTVPLVVQVSMIRPVVITRRSINQGATIQASDVELTPLSFTRLNKLGLGDVAQAIGLRAKRFVAAGTMLESPALESVPLVLRGQLVRLQSVAGGVQIVTTGKAMRDGLLGEVVAVRSLANKRVEFDAIVIGPGSVRIGTGPTTRVGASIAMGEPR